MVRIGIVGDFDTHYPPHTATNESIRDSADSCGMAVAAEWVLTERIDAEGTSAVDIFDGLWIAPGSPYLSMEGALKAIQLARLEGVPLLGTCGGFQHVVLEFARHVLHVEDAQHAEYDPYASRLFITPLSCSLVGQRMTVALDPTSRAARTYGKTRVSEAYYCNFGLNPKYERDLELGGLRITGRDLAGEARILELPAHPFFVATLFVPQLSSSAGRPHPLVTAFLTAALARQVGGQSSTTFS
ncbi:MAG TPA: hypothetical protein VGN73_06290 [Gemmatimonadaceae bacterium]|nr:hypothetical protein [Gemmatimonadaceae bacterium]